MVLPQDIAFVLTCKELLANVKNIDPKQQHDTVNDLFVKLNYPLSDAKERSVFSLKKIETNEMPESTEKKKVFYASVDSAQEDEKHKIAAYEGGSVNIAGAVAAVGKQIVLIVCALSVLQDFKEPLWSEVIDKLRNIN